MGDMPELLCRVCGKFYAYDKNKPHECPLARPMAKVGEIIDAKSVSLTKKPWVKPTITRWVKAEVFTPCSQDVVVNKPVNKVESVNTPVNSGVTPDGDRKAYRREWMKRKRDAAKAAKV